jgi:acetyl esterase/lipase
MMVAGQDLLRGENFQYAQNLQEANVPVVVREYKGAPHPFMSMDGVLESGKQGMDDLVKDMEKISAEHLEHSVIKPSDVYNELDRENLVRQAQDMQGRLSSR